MISHHAPSAPPDPELVRSLELRVRPLPHRPNRWAWDLKDGRDGTWFESMWEFDSAERARRSGLSRILELSRPGHGDTIGAPPSGEKNSHIVIVARHEDELYRLFTRAFGGSHRVQVIRDRRRSSAMMDRRGFERRFTDVGVAVRTRGWAIVDRARAQRGGQIDEAA